MEGQISKDQVSPESFVEAMRQETEQMLREVMAAVNEGPGRSVDQRQRKQGPGPDGRVPQTSL
jgi:hypothetical protein